jgi:hypothetical protein
MLPKADSGLGLASVRLVAGTELGRNKANRTKSDWRRVRPQNASTRYKDRGTSVDLK